ncbi:3210_t:CDS:2 [Funneliformis geosporum]|uniref:7889_t:CDS:1 n=1 Tax=Funneliformis geosporum TaxID=1117311 RepID=A0A9W4T5P5_9GLOM|nr:7889_t:CDS:2 [Funneliformis geosporum]CAI2192184.1 3210_t:CDS:2 [Funneliformis geosporum]
MKLDINTLETQLIIEDWFNINEDNENETTKNLTSCVLIEKVEGKIQKCKNTESFRTLWQLVGTWQIDSEKILEVDCDLICEPAFEDIKNLRYICSEYYELEGGHFHIKPGKGRTSATCFHDQDVKKNLEIIAHWLLYVKNNKDEEY